MDGRYLVLMILSLVTITILGFCNPRAYAHETCFYKHGKYGLFYQLIHAEMGERLVRVAPADKDDTYILVRGFIFTTEYPDGLMGKKKIQCHRSPMFWVSRENAWEEFQIIKERWMEACGKGVWRY